MQPAARIASLIELLGEVEAAIQQNAAPADVLVGNYFRARRYAGSKDRRFISDTLYKILRQRELLLWCAEKLQTEACARFLTVCWMTLNDGASLALFSDEGMYGPEPLSEQEQVQIEALRVINCKAAPQAARLNMPAWALPGFEARYGESWLVAAEALNKQASVDLRLNGLKSKDRPRDSFHGGTVALENTRWSPIGLRSEGNVALGSIDDYKRGLLEVQDEAAQVASLIVEAKPGMQVVDFCAGAGGKSLTVAAQMENKGQLYAFDISAKRLDVCKKRAQRAGTRNIQVAQLPENTEARSAQLSNLYGQCDRVFVDVPCSGTGTWRRSPDQRWRHTVAGLTDLNELQFSLLSEAALLVRPGARLIYMTCSVLPEENEGIVSRFLGQSSDWRLLHYKDIWDSAIGDPAPETLASIAESLQLSPEHHQTDGFFIAVIERA